MVVLGDGWQVEVGVAGVMGGRFELVIRLVVVGR